jgi:hypothetical protein
MDTRNGQIDINPDSNPKNYKAKFHTGLISKWTSLSAPNRTVLKLMPIFVLLFATALTVNLTQQQQNIKQNAATLATGYYLAPGGNDSAAGTIGAPWGTLAGSIAKLKPGDTLYVRGGTYVVTTQIAYVTAAGTAAAPITVTNYPGETPTFTSTILQEDYLYFNTGSQYITLSGLTFKGPDLVAQDSNGEGLIGFIGNASHITLSGNTFLGSSAWNSQQHLVYLAADSVNNITITGNTFDGMGSKGSGITAYHDPNATGVIVSNNTIKNVDQGLLIWSTISGLVVEGNTFSGDRINIRHHNSNGTTVTNNFGAATSTNILADSTVNLTVSTNNWTSAPTTAPTNTPAPTAKSTPTPTLTPTPTRTNTPTPLPTSAPTSAPVLKSTPTPTLTPTPTRTNTPTPTQIVNKTPTPTPTLSKAPMPNPKPPITKKKCVRFFFWIFCY